MLYMPAVPGESTHLKSMNFFDQRTPGVQSPWMMDATLPAIMRSLMSPQAVEAKSGFA